MKDEEMAEEYANNIDYTKTVKIFDYVPYHENCDVADMVAQAFLAGLKAGRPQWHTPNVPTSPINKVVLGYIKDCNSKKLCLVEWNGEWWYDANTYNDRVKVIAWCEIPTFDKE